MRILYAEDYELDAELTKILLEEHEFTVDIAADGKKHGMPTIVKSPIFYYSISTFLGKTGSKSPG